jgi:beta-ketodecanoyl-[acyl-carrier-protein] synthase
MPRPVITSTGLWTPSEAISNAELVESYNAWADLWNREREADIKSGLTDPKPHSSVEFIEKASGIKSRYVIDKNGILDPFTMAPRIAERPNEEISVLAEIAVHAARDALDRAGRRPEDIDAVICAASNMQRPYPAMAIEVQDALGISGFAFDMNVACSSATFGIQTAAGFISSCDARSVLIVNPEICSGHLNFTDRDSHFIFGDVATAILVEAEDVAGGAHWSILGTRLKTQFSNNIRNNFGFLNRGAPEGIGAPDKLFVQEGRKVFKEVVPLVSAMITEHMAELRLAPGDLRRMWLHQANANMNRLIANKVLGHEASEDESPTVLDVYANTSSAGSIIAFHKNSDDLKPGDKGLICSFGAGYSAGTVFVERAG